MTSRAPKKTKRTTSYILDSQNFGILDVTKHTIHVFWTLRNGLAARTAPAGSHAVSLRVGYLHGRTTNLSPLSPRPRVIHNSSVLPRDSLTLIFFTSQSPTTNTNDRERAGSGNGWRRGRVLLRRARPARRASRPAAGGGGGPGGGGPAVPGRRRRGADGGRGGAAEPRGAAPPPRLPPVPHPRPLLRPRRRGARRRLRLRRVPRRRPPRGRLPRRRRLHAPPHPRPALLPLLALRRRRRRRRVEQEPAAAGRFAGAREGERRGGAVVGASLRSPARLCWGVFFV